ncbi:MAG: ABC transporter ATP-binding protein [Alphaproteobacteria bacterium]|nr:ABC transporter ATP-binding protein [Alphaproteobacteria bacterium]
MSLLLKAVQLEKTHHQGDQALVIFKDISLALHRGEIVALVGPSGSGKSTLLQMIGLLDRPTNGSVMILAKDAGVMNDDERTLMRRHKIGFVYQFHFLQPEFSALENVMIPQLIAGISKVKAREEAMKLLSEMGLAHRVHHRPARLSGGEQQRVAIARALANHPVILLADEPTGNLDPQTSAEVFDVLLNRVRSAGIGAIIATHNMELAQKMDRILIMNNGQLQEQRAA